MYIERGLMPVNISRNFGPRGKHRTPPATLPGVSMTSRSLTGFDEGSALKTCNVFLKLLFCCSLAESIVVKK